MNLIQHLQHFAKLCHLLKLCEHKCLVTTNQQSKMWYWQYQACSLNGHLTVNEYAFIGFAIIRGNESRIVWVANWGLADFLVYVDAGNLTAFVKCPWFQLHSLNK